ncbi:MAG: Eco57I restriction-modification methylase domain-containing protein, partial [Flavobacteriales bacterium]
MAHFTGAGEFVYKSIERRLNAQSETKPDTTPTREDWRNSIATARQYANKLISEGVLQRPDVVNVWGAPKLTELVAAIDAALESVSAPVQTEPTATQDNTNEPTRDDANRPKPLADTLAEGVQNPSGQRDTTEGGGSQRETNPDGNGRESAPRPARTVGSGAGTVYSDQAIGGSGRVSDTVTRSDGSETTLEQAAKTDTNTAPQAPKPTKLKGQSAGNYVITDADAIGTGTVGQRLANNMAAIRLVRKLQAEGRYATKEEQAVLVKYVGWGGLANAFDGNAKQKQFRDANTELKALLSDQEFQEAWKSTRNAHYTATGVIDAMYDALSFFGFKGGRVLEPTVGTGNFVGRMPQAMSENSDWYASELDPITSAIAAQLYPDAQVLQATGFEDANFAYGRYDVAIGNPPFGDIRLTDNNKNRKHLSGMKIHNYVIAKSGMHLRAGGVMAMVVTHRFLDTKNDEARTELAKNFHFVGAVRLPNTAFAENANTEVTTDIVFFQKREQGDTTQTEADQLWLDTSATIKAPDGADIRINGYFAKHPEMMLGTPTLDGTMYSGARGAEFTLNPIEGMDLSTAIRDAIKTGMADYRDTMENSTSADTMAFAPPSMNRSDVAIGGYYFDEGKLYQRMDDDTLGNSAFRELTPDTQWTEKTKLGQTRYDRIVGQLNLRAATQEMISLEMQDAPKNILNDKRKALNAMYDAFVKEHGFISDNANRSLMDGDIGLESGLELSYTKAITAARAKAMGVDPKPAKAVKADILTRRVFEPRRTVETASSPEDAYLISIAERGRLDLEYMSGLLDMPISEITKKLSSAEKPLIFKDPKTEEWVQYDEYLSGNVKAKYQDAMDAGMDKNAAALKTVFPKDVEPKDLHITIRSTWIPPVYFEQFLEVLGAVRPKVSINPITGAMSVQASGGSKETELSGEFKSSDYKIEEMLTELVNGRTLVARDYDPVAKRNHVNAQRTKELSAMAKNLKALFVDWMGGDSERMDAAAKAFNQRMNTHAERSFNGREMLVTYGANPSIELRNTQKDAAFRMIQSPAVLLDHVVGAGKTFTLITGIVERRRLGLSKKPMIAVPNHLVGQWAADFFKLYPAARVLAATPKDFQKQNRQKLFARIATGDFDAIILGHSSLKFLEMDKDAEERFISEEVAYIQKALDAARESDDKRSIKSLANTMAKKEQRIKALKDAPKDTVVTWGQLGIDYLAIDESHEFKNLEYSTGMQRVSGMNDPKGSQRAFDLYMKIRELRSNGGGVAFATGTPISNSLVEMYTILRYLNREELKARGQDVFDAWLSAYGEIDDRIELTATQQLKERKVLASFGNMPELLQLYREFADVITMDDLKRIHAEQVREKNERTGSTESEVFPVPKVKNGGRVLNKGNLSDAQQEYMDYLVARAQQIQKLGKEQDLKIDNLLWIQNDAKKMSLDIRLVDPSASDSADSKSSRASREIARIYQQSTPQKGTQLVFLDMSTPAKGADKEAAKIIKAALESTKLKDDRILKTMMDGESYQDQWRAILSRVDQITESEASDPESVAKLEDWRDKLDSDIEGVMTTADTGFSVYDDLKQKLIAQGVPENEIAFIHDYNTSDRKQELFGLVNAGVIRVLLGSTPKMGAGTNAQARLVALHHLDASMHNRPSDIEQREGRIIRQGNELYAADPDNFEVEIIAYSTERTFDAVQWQTLERKASMLEQFRSGERGMREPNGDAAGYAEFMAESTGNPAFKRKIELESQLDLLEANRRRYMARTSEAKRTVASYESSQSARRDELAVLEPAQVDEFASAEFGGKQFANDYAKGLKQEVEAFTRELDQYEADMVAYRKDKELYDKATNAEQEEMTKPKSPKKPENHGIASKRMRAASQWSDFVGQFLEDADKKGSARAKVGDFELVLRGESTKSANGERQWELYLQKDGYTVDLVNSFEAKGKTPYLTKIFVAMQPRKLAAEVGDRVDDLNQRMQSGKTKYDLALKIADKQFDGQGALDQAKFEYEAVKKLVDEALTEDEARRNAISNKYVSSDSNRFGSGIDIRNTQEGLASRKDSQSVSGQTVEQVRDLLTERFGADVVAKLEANG